MNPEDEKLVADLGRDADAILALDAWELGEGEPPRVSWQSIAARQREAASAISRLSAEVKELREALTESMVALDDWLNTYAPEFRDEGRVQEARNRIGQYGTVRYIAHVQERNRAALKPETAK